MQFRFDANQEFQTKAIESVARLFDGQKRIETELTFSPTGGFASVGNTLDISEDVILQNLHTTQEESGLSQDKELQFIKHTIETANGETKVRFVNFSVEMETGTGKTYVYLRTALELYRRYGMRKFIIVVPSVAVREGVIKTLSITYNHFRSLYDNVPMHSASYDSGNLSKVRQFALSDSVEFMIMTIDSFNKTMDDDKKGNVIHRRHDRMGGEKPIHLVQSVRPILILDEPQNMESELSQEALSLLNPLFALRYSATHKNHYNLVYRLTPFDAYRQGLVKSIQVAGTEQRDDANAPFMRLELVKSEKSVIKAQIAVHKLMKDGTVKEKVITLDPKKDSEKPLSEHTGLPQYADYTVDMIEPGEQCVYFTNGTKLRVGETKGADKEAIFEAQIAYTIETHMQRQAQLKTEGVKVLSLFFIDRVDNYVSDDGIIRKLFDKSFNRLKEKYPAWKDMEPEKVRTAYFAQKKTKKGEVTMEDSKSGETDDDRKAYDLILKDKEQLLSFEEPRCFIFSHSALREGWDNPNVFQICTLNQTSSEMKKRQEIGRGVRLAVNQQGERVPSEQVNVLTVVANESYEHYVKTLQNEIERDYGLEGVPPKPANARKPFVAKLRKNRLLSPEFKQLWDKISQKTRYAVTIDTKKLVADVVTELKGADIRSPRVTITKARVEVQDNETDEGKVQVFSALQMSGAKTVVDLGGRYALPNVLDMIEHLLEYTTPPVRLTRSTLLMIVREANHPKAMENPQEFASTAARIIKLKIAQQLVDGIHYEKIDDWYEMEQFAMELPPEAEEYFVPSPHGLYDYVRFESEIEKAFAEGLEKREDVLLYVKLPSWFTVSTPIGSYNPDWAILMEEDDGKSSLYLVRETKSQGFFTNPRVEEKQKTVCGERHFKDALKVDYKIVTGASELP